MNFGARMQPGAALAVLALHALILAAILASRQDGEPAGEPRWIVLSLPATAPPPKPAERQAAAPPRSLAAKRPVARATPVQPLPAAPVPEMELVSPAPDFGPPAPRVGDRQVREAISAAIREDDAKRAKFIRAAPPPGITEKFAAGAKAAEVPGCLRPDALKHNPPTVGPIVFGGILSLPWLAGAALTGKCK